MTDLSKIEELQQLLNFDSEDASVSLLEDSDWDIQAAVETFFDRQSKEAEQQQQQPRQQLPQLPQSSSVAGVGLGLARWPVSWIWNVCRGLLFLVVKLLRLPVWLYALIFSKPSSLADSPPPHVSPQDANSLLISSIHEAVNSEEPSSSTTALASTRTRAETHSIPSFYLGSPSEALRDARENAQFAIIALVDNDTPSTQFRYHTLANNRLSSLIDTHQCLIWAGDVTSNRAAWNYAKNRGVSSLPHVEFHSLQALPTSRNALVSTPTMTHLSTLNGADALGDAFIDTLTSRHLNRISPYLTRLRKEKYERQRATYLREAAEKAENERMQQDAEKVLRRRRELAESSRRAEEAAVQKEQEEVFKLDREAQLLKHRIYIRSSLPKEPASGVRLAFKLADGRRIVRNFSPQSSLDMLYSYIDTIDVDSENAADASPLDDYTPTFNLYTSYPRTHIPNEQSRSIGDVEGLSKGGFVVVESTIARADSDEESEEGEEGEESD